MIDLDMPTACGFGVCLIAFLGPYFYGFFLDKYEKDAPDPRRRTF